jgi:hypothetical protein
VRTPAPVGGGRSELAGRAGDDDTRTRNNSPSVAQRVTALPVRSLTAALDLLDSLDLCCCWTAPHDRRCKRLSR